MKTLLDLCKPRASVFDETKREDVLNLSDLNEGNIDCNRFFEENYITDGMSTLLITAFNRFINEGQTGIIKLTQAMGGGKTHNMLALGLLAANPEYRVKVLPDADRYKDLNQVRVVSFSGRESDAPFGIWGAIAEQLGKKEVFAQYYSPLKAPGETAWINLLSGEPLLILLDELPPYLENAKSIEVGHSDLSAVTSTALSNLFTAINKAQLSNVCLVISDLKATYESGSELIRSTFRNIDHEISRSALDIEPVGSASDDVYHILKKRLFEELPEEYDVILVALGYQEEVKKAKDMALTNVSPDSIYTGIKDSYPFHPSIRDLYARFKENPGFQQTRGLIRLMRQVVTGLYDPKDCKAKNKFLINVHDFDLNNRAMHASITQIKPELTNAIAHDIAANGKAVAEEIDSQLQSNMVTDVSKLILSSSLANVPNALLGLSIKEIIGYLCEPGRDITGFKNALDEFQMKAWYLELNKEGKLLFRNTKNMIAQMHSLVESFHNEDVKATTLKLFLEDKFKPLVGDCYQHLEVFPAIDEIDLSQDKATLILFEPYTGSGLHPDLQQFYDNALYKNRVMFLSGSRDTMDRLYDAAKHLKAIERIIKNMRDDKVPEDNQQFILADDTKIKKINAVLSAAQQTFSTLYFPMGEGLRNSDFNMQFKDNNYNGEEQVKNILLEKQKFSNKPIDDSLRLKCEQRLFTMDEMRWSDVKHRAATEIKWQWFHPRTLDKLLEDCLQKDLWRKFDEYIRKGPFQEPTSVTVTVKEEDEQTGKVRLKLHPHYGDTIYYEIGAEATTASLKVEDPNNFESSALKVSFLCEDSTGKNPTGQPSLWIRDIKVKYKLLDKADGKYLIMQAPGGVSIRYTTDGSNPKGSGGLYDGEFKVPADSSYIQYVAEHESDYYDEGTIKIDQVSHGLPSIDKDKPLTLNRIIRGSDTSETYVQLDALKKHASSVRDVHIVLYKRDEQGRDAGYIELAIDSKIDTSFAQIEETIDNLKKAFIVDGKANIVLEVGLILFETGQDFLNWANAKKMSLSGFKQEEIRQ